MIRQSFKALHQKTQEPLAGDAHGATATAQGYPFAQQAFNKPTLVLCNAVLRETLDELAPTVGAVMVLFAVIPTTPLYLAL